MRWLVLLLFLVMCRSDKRKIPIHDARYTVGFFTFGRAVRYDDGAPLLGRSANSGAQKESNSLSLQPQAKALALWFIA